MRPDTPYMALPAALLALLMANSGCGATASDLAATEETSPPAQETRRPAELPATARISYADTASWLEGLPLEERRDQVQDWAVLGLASLLETDVEAYRNFGYDKVPLRDPLFEDLSAARVGPGRSFSDAAGTLHLLIPEDDPHERRTIGSLLDDHRKDSGSDPGRVRVHHFRLDADDRQLVIESGSSETPAEVRSRNGYRSLPIRTGLDLERFLAATQHLSRLEVREGTLWASGWDWPGVPTGQVTSADLAVLQRGYERADQGLGPEPGFSLDPGSAITSNELFVSMFPEDRRARAREVVESVDETVNAVKKRVSEGAWDEEEAGLELERRLEELHGREPFLFAAALRTWTQKPLYQSARYDGGLEGTEAGMTYFYTDLLAKAWAMELGSSNPAGVVPGFVSDLDARTPWAHCKEEIDESGRVWFGLREEAIATRDRSIDLGGVVTRLFTLVQDPSGDREIEPSYTFGRIVYWWDRHYVPMADYEPQYHRLDQLMRWGAALGWLVDVGDSRLPTPPPETVRANWHFEQWLSSRDDLRWHYRLPWVAPVGAAAESFLVLDSQTTEDCGSEFNWSGGISNARLDRLRELRLSRPSNLPPGLARGGLSGRVTSYFPATGSGVIGDPRLKRQIGAIENGTSNVETIAGGRKVWSFGRLKTWIGETTDRRVTVRFTARDGRLGQRIEVQGLDLGELSVERSPEGATIRWQPGYLDRARRALHTLEEALPQGPLSRAIQKANGASLSYYDPVSRRAYLRVDGAGETHWMAVEEGLPARDSQLRFRLGSPGDDGPSFYSARLSDAPAVHLDGAPAGWFSVGGGTGGGPGSIGGSRPPGSHLARFEVRDPGGPRRGVLHWDRANDRAIARTNDPVFGLEGHAAGGDLLRDLALLRRLEAAGEVAASYGPDASRPVALSDGRIGLVKGRTVDYVEADHPWHQRVKLALDRSDAGDDVFVKFSGGQPLVGMQPRVDGVSPPQGGGRLTLGELLGAADAQAIPGIPRGPPPPVRVENQVRVLLSEANLPAEALGTELQIRLIKLNRAATASSSVGLLEGIDFLRWDRAEWVAWRALPGGTGNTVAMIYHAGDCDRNRDLRRCPPSGN